MTGKYNVGSVVLGNWTLKCKLGEGSFGTVFEAERVDFGQTYKAAVKIITIPQNESELKSVQGDSMDDESVSTYFRGFVEELAAEFALMSRIKGHSNVVSYEDHAVIPHDEGIGWDIVIRMELLTPLLDHVRSTAMTQTDVIRLGIDICKALELCQKHSIIHRDIKPENIFLADSGDYKLGDFGIARTVEKTSSGMSKKGTYSYMAPEVYKEEPYGAGADIYSLGLVLYWLLNDRRTPFLPAAPAAITPADRDSALRRRFKGENIPAPKNADDQLAKIVLKACAYDPNERYADPAEMRGELEAALAKDTNAPVIPRPEDTASAGLTAGEYEEKTELLISVGAEKTAVDQQVDETVIIAPEEKTEAASVVPDTSQHSEPPRVLKTEPKSTGETPTDKKKPGVVLWGGLAAGLVIVLAICAFLLFRLNNSGDITASEQPTPSAAAGDEETQLDNSAGNTEIANYLISNGILDEQWFERPDDTIDRASWAKIVHRMVTGSDDADGWFGVETNLNDVAGSWAESYISFVVANGYDCDDGAGNYNPDNAVLVAEACKTMLTVLGYDAKDCGYQDSVAWAGNAMADAKKAGLMTGVDMDQTSLAPLNRKNAGTLIYNTLNTNAVRMNTEATGDGFRITYSEAGLLASYLPSTANTDSDLARNPESFVSTVIAPADSLMLNNNVLVVRVPGVMNAYVPADRVSGWLPLFKGDRVRCSVTMGYDGFVTYALEQLYTPPDETAEDVVSSPAPTASQQPTEAVPPTTTPVTVPTPTPTPTPPPPMQEETGICDDWAEITHKSEVKKLNSRGILRLRPDGKFYPSDHIDRASWAKMLFCAAFGSDDADAYLGTVDESEISDASGSWAEGYISAIYSRGYINSGAYRPSDNVKVGEAAEMVLRALGKSSGDAMSAARSNGLIDNSSLSSGSYLTRDDAALMLSKLAR